MSNFLIKTGLDATKLHFKKSPHILYNGSIMNTTTFIPRLQNMPKSTRTPSDNDYESPVFGNRILPLLRGLFTGTLQFNKDKHEVILQRPGLQYGSFTRDGHPAIHSLFMMMLTARAYIYHVPMVDSGATFLEYDKMTDGVLTFMASSEFEIENTMYDFNVIKDLLNIKINLGNIGKTSLNSVAEVTLPSNGRTLMKNVNQIVLVDRLTRKPIAVPEWWREKYSPYTIRNQPLIIPSLYKPDHFYSYKLHVGWSDTDTYNHTNSIAYPRFAINAIQSASSAQFFKVLSRDVLKSGIKKIQMSFVGESKEGDLLEVCVWEDADKTIAHCEFLNGDKPIFYCIVAYHSPGD